MGSDYPFPLGECVPSADIYPGRLIRQVYSGDENVEVPETYIHREKERERGGGGGVKEG
jgi:hypothetical protein